MTSLDAGGVERLLQRLVRDYQDLNSAHVIELAAPPSSREFAVEFAGRNRPVVVRAGSHAQIPAVARWTNEYLVERLGERKVAVSLSPDGYADSIVGDVGLGGDFFVEPASCSMTLSDLFSELPPTPDARPHPVVHYMQSQNGNLHPGSDFEILLDDVGPGPRFARDVLGGEAESTNVWIGDARSVTTLHKDPYENIYTVCRGSKTFVLLPPHEYYCLHEQFFPHAVYEQDPTGALRIVPSPLKTRRVPWIPVDPVAPNLHLFPRFAHARPTTVTLYAGDMLYLPAMWYHRVSQTTGPSPDGKGVPLAIAVNWWTPMRYDGAAYALSTFVRGEALGLDGTVEEEELED